MHPRVLILSPHVYPEPHSGVGMRGHFQCVYLSQNWPITLATDTGIYDVCDGIFTHRLVSRIDERPSPNAYLRSLVTRKHYLYEKYSCGRWVLPNLDDFTHIIVHYPALIHFLTERPNLRASIIFDTHNNEREYFESVAAQTPNHLKRRVIRRQAAISENIIINAAPSIAATISVSESDRDWIASLSPDRVEHFVVPNSLFRYKPTKWSGRRNVLFVGSLNVTMNLQALNWFTSNVWPRLRELSPGLEFVVAGRNPSPNLVADLQRQGVRVVANAESLHDLYQDAICSVIPASSGSGAKIKVGEALAHGVPVITTSHGLVGQPAALKNCCSIYDEPSDWIDAIRSRADNEHRSTEEWDRTVKSALDASFFGSSIRQIADFIQSEGADLS